ncbi:hypothetical protein [Desulfovibrio subterraneus]|uniref:hypothetical protein n=1 Tax=Desulfovibrio subterraneus TaxID=2718620 RepID=UPI00157B1B55|nr:hypothetical protein [Desulfovibrio subterraneus]
MNKLQRHLESVGALCLIEVGTLRLALDKVEDAVDQLKARCKRSHCVCSAEAEGGVGIIHAATPFGFGPGGTSFASGRSSAGRMEESCLCR